MLSRAMLSRAMAPQVMGIVNVTPDSFSDGGLWLQADAALAQARRLIVEGADIIDIGGESSRPGAQPVSEATELARVLPVIEALAEHLASDPAPCADSVEISIDTVKPSVAEAAVAAGATIINDISARLEAVAAATGAGWLAMHTSGPSSTMQDDPHYDDVVAQVGDFLEDALERGGAAGVTRIWIDPGIGFGKTLDHNLELLARLPILLELATRVGAGVAVGVSRKQSIAELHAHADRGSTSSNSDRLEGSVALALWAALQGVDILRVHDAGPTVEALDVVARGCMDRPAS